MCNTPSIRVHEYTFIEHVLRSTAILVCRGELIHARWVWIRLYFGTVHREWKMNAVVAAVLTFRKLHETVSIGLWSSKLCRRTHRAQVIRPPPACFAMVINSSSQYMENRSKNMSCVVPICLTPICCNVMK